MPQGNPTSRAVHVDRALDNLSLAFVQDAAGFIADTVFPPVPVGQQSNKYFIYDRDMYNTDSFKPRATGTQSARDDFKLSTDSYYCDKWSLGVDLDWDTIDNQDSVLDLENDSAEYLALKALIKRERAWADAYFKAGVWTTDVTGVASGPTGAQVLQWSVTDSTPIEDVRKYMTVVHKLSGFRPNTMVIGREVADILVDHPDIVARIDSGQTPNGPAVVEYSDLANLFKIPRVLVMDAIYNTAEEGASESNAFIGGKGAMLCHTAARPGRRTPSAGYNFVWRARGCNAQGMRTMKFDEQKIQSTTVETDMFFDYKVTSAQMGAFFASIVA